MLSPKLKDMFAVAKELPAAPQILSELAEMLQDINTETEAISALLRQDAPLAAAILRAANSPYYGCGGVGDVDGAINRVGFREVHRLVGYAATGLLADRVLTFYGIDPEALREHMIASAFACEYLAGRTGFNPRHAYTAGLLRPVGMLVLDRMAKRALPDTDIFNLERDGDYGVWEGKVMEIRNAAVATVVMTEWRFSKDVVEAIRGHLLTAGAAVPTSAAAILHLSVGVTDRLQLGLPGEQKYWEATPAKLQLAGLTADDLEQAFEDTQVKMDQIRLAYSAS
ncbi:MAG TPA: HDOD domain-containing protein [Opitutaceae bacterium]